LDPRLAWGVDVTVPVVIVSGATLLAADRAVAGRETLMPNRRFDAIGSLPFLLLAGALVATTPLSPRAADQPASDEELAKELNNPVANLVSIPFQYNFDHKLGPDEDGKRHRTNIQPVIPISISEKWNIISRTILPVIGLQDVPVDGDDEFGLGDTLQSLFLSPQNPTSVGLIWGAGPAFLIPTGTDKKLGTEKFGLGPTAVGLVQKGHWTVGVLANHIWSVAGDDDREDVSSTYMQPFIVYTTPGALSIALNTESTYDWEAEEWTVPLNLVVSQLFRFSPRLPPVSIGVGPRYWIDTPPGGPDKFGIRAQLTLLFPK
jgi:hypothetical protein